MINVLLVAGFHLLVWVALGFTLLWVVTSFAERHER